MVPLVNLLTTCQVQMGWETALEPYPNCRFRYFEDLDHQFHNRSVPTQTQAGSDSPELLLLVCNGTSSSTRWLPSLAKWHRNESADTLVVQRNRNTSARSSATTAWNATGSSWWQWVISSLQFGWCATQICVYTYCSSSWSIFPSSFIYQKSQAWWRFYSRFGDWGRSINWLVHYMLRGTAADITFANKSSLLREPDREDRNWYAAMWFLGIIIMYNSRTP